MAMVATMGQQGNPALVVEQLLYLELLLLSLYLAAGQPAGAARRRNQMMTMERAKAKVCLLSAFTCFCTRCLLLLHIHVLSRDANCCLGGLQSMLGICIGDNVSSHAVLFFFAHIANLLALTVQ